MTHDQAAADREKIAGAYNKAIEKDDVWPPEHFYRLDAAVHAFEVLCEPKGWRLMRSGIGTWWTKNAGNVRFYAHDHINHAADVCQLVCEVLDREQAEAPKTTCQAD